MTIREEAIIHRLPSFVWPYLTNVELIPRWNDKITRMEAVSQGGFRVHYQFKVTYHMKGKEREFAAEVTECNEPQRIVTRQLSIDGEPLAVTETIRLTPVRQGTKVQRIIEFPSESVPWWARTLVWFITKLGKPVGEPVLEKLGRMVEQGR